MGVRRIDLLCSMSNERLCVFFLLEMGVDSSFLWSLVCRATLFLTRTFLLSTIFIKVDSFTLKYPIFSLYVVEISNLDYESSSKLFSCWMMRSIFYFPGPRPEKMAVFGVMTWTFTTAWGGVVKSFQWHTWYLFGPIHNIYTEYIFICIDIQITTV